MSLNALGTSQLALKAASSVVAVSDFSYTSGNYAGLSSSAFDMIVGKTGALVGGTIDIPLSILDIPTAAVGQACIIEAWLNNTATGAGVTTIGAKYVGVIVTAGGPPITSALLRISAQDATGAIAATFVGQLGFRILIPRNV